MPNALQRYLHSKDKLAKTTSLTYQNKKTWGTSMGGCCSRTISFLLFTVFTIEAVSLVSKPQYTYNSGVTYQNVNETFNLTFK